MTKKIALLLSGMILLSACGAPAHSAASTAAESAPAQASSVDSSGLSAPSGEITLSGDSITVSGNGAKVSGSTVTITQSGNYTVSGTLSDGQTLVDAGKEDDITLTLSGVSITCTQSAPIFIKKASSVSIVLADGTDNTVADTDNYVLDEGEDEPDAAIFSKADLSISGSGSLHAEGNYDMAIHSKDFLYFDGNGTYDILAAGDGVKGKDGVQITGTPTMQITAGSDGIASSNKKDASLGGILVNGGTLSVTAGKHGLNAQTQLSVLDGTLTIDAQQDGLHAAAAAEYPV